MSNCILLIFTLAINLMFYVGVLLIYTCNYADTLYHLGIHPSLPHGVLCLSSMTSWLPLLLAYQGRLEPSTAKQSALFICIRTNTTLEVAKLQNYLLDVC